MKPATLFLRRALAALGLLGLLGLLAGCAGTPDAVPEAQAQRLGALFQTALPIGKVVDAVAARYPDWPLQSVPRDRYTPAQLACVRAVMSAGGIQKRQMDDARRYAATRGPALAEDIALLESGAAHALGQLIQAGANVGIAKSANEPPSVQRAINQAGRAAARQLQPDELKSLMTLLLSPRHEPLRKAMQIDSLASALVAPGDRDRQQAFAQGKALGASFMIDPLFAALHECQLPLSALEPD